MSFKGFLPMLCSLICFIAEAYDLYVLGLTVDNLNVSHHVLKYSLNVKLG